MWLMAVCAWLCDFMRRLEHEHLLGMTAEAIVVSRLYAGMRFVALVTV